MTRLEEDLKTRGTGRTTRQIEYAPRHAVFIWCNHATDYPKMLAKRLGRDDLEIVPPDWLDDGKWRGLKLSGIVVDHATVLDGERWGQLQDARIWSSHAPQD